MKILVFEWLTSGGRWHDGVVPDWNTSIHAQGLQMLKAITEDFLEYGAGVVVPLDERLGDRIPGCSGPEIHPVGESDLLPECLGRLAEGADCVMLIAPESQSCLLKCLEWIEPFHNKLISPGHRFVEIASNKEETFQYLNAHGFDSIPDGMSFANLILENNELPDTPHVIKPILGAGSEGVQLLTDRVNRDRGIRRSPDQYWVEPFIRGMPVSVSVLCGQVGNQFLPPTRQVFDQEPFGNYVKASYPIEPDLADRATRVAQTAIKTMPNTQGYVGIDIVVSDQGERSDRLIEINPRLTMSYLKLRDVCHENLAGRILELANCTNGK